MSQEIIDLDASGVIATPKTIRLHGRTYDLPGDIPATLYVKLQQVVRTGLGDGPGARQIEEDLHNEALALFNVYQPDLDRLPLGLNELVRAITYVYSTARTADQAAAGEGDVDPTPPAKKPRSRSRSSTS